MADFSLILHQLPSMNKTFFIADDDPDDQEFFMDALKSICGTCTLLQAYNGEEALHVLESQLMTPPDFIFLDLNMPKLSGKQCLEEIRKNKTLRDVPVIIYTTSSLTKDKEESLKLGATQFMVKPTSIHVLKRELETMLKRAS